MCSCCIGSTIPENKNEGMDNESKKQGKPIQGCVTELTSAK